MNFVVGERGFGKTYGFLKHFGEKWIKNREQFLYVRRYQTEIDYIGKKLYDAHIKNNEFGEHIITAGKEKYLCDGEVFCYMVPLSNEGKLKSVPLPNVKYILFDEFLITNPNQRYMKNEPVLFLSLIESVFRERDPHVYCLGNASTVTNPYFDYFHLKIPYQSEYATFKNGLIAVNYACGTEFREQKIKSKFGQIIKDTSYGAYSIKNEFLMDDGNFISKKTPKAWLFACLYIEQRNFGLWIDSNTGNMYISKKYDPKNPRNFALLISDHIEGVRLATARNNPWFRKLIECYKNNKLFFENIQIKNYVIKAIKPYL